MFVKYLSQLPGYEITFLVQSGDKFQEEVLRSAQVNLNTTGGIFKNGNGFCYNGHEKEKIS
jgi:hypothetical protein